MKVTACNSKSAPCVLRTVDAQHAQFVTQVKKKSQHMAELLALLAEQDEGIRRGTQELEGGELGDDARRQALVDRINQAKDRLHDLQAQVQQLQRHSDELDYISNTASILYTYYDLMENGQSAAATKKPCNDINSILSYFVEPDAASTTADTHVPAKTRGNLLEQYLIQTDPDYIAPVTAATPGQERCYYCKSADVTLMMSEGYQYCNHCYTMEPILTSDEKPSYRDPPKEVSYYSYKRINHYVEFECMGILVRLCEMLIA